MPQVVAVAVAAFQAAAVVATTVGTAMGFSGLAATVVGASALVSSTQQAWSLVSSALSPKPKVGASATQLQTKVGAVTPRAIVMGRTAVAGTLLTPTPLKSGKDNRFATNFYTLSHVGPSGVVESIQWGDDTVTFDGNGNAIGKYNDNMWLFQKNGSWSQTAISFAGHAVLGSSTPAAWDSTKRAQGCLVVALVVRYAASILASNMQTPVFVVDANAVVLTDPRTGSAATTQAQRRNPAVWAYSWRLGWSQNSQRVIGMNQPSGEIHTAGYAYLANVADTNGWTIAGEATTADDTYAVESRMLQTCAAISVERGGLQSVAVSASQSVVGTITSDMLRAKPKWRYQTELSSRPNAIQPKYRSESNRWQMIEGSEITDSSYVTADRGVKKSTPVDYPYVGGGAAQVGHLAALDLANSREGFVFSLQCKQNARYIGFVGERVNVSLPEIGLSTTKMAIVDRFVNPDGTVDYDLLVETDAKYAFAAGKTSVAPSFTLQPGFDIFSVPQPGVAEWASVAAQITSGATSLPIVRVTGSAADYSFASGVVFKIRLNSGGSPWLVSEDAPPAATQHEFRGLTNNTSYIVGIAYRGVTGVEGPVRELAAVTTGTLVAGEAGIVPVGQNILRNPTGAIGTRYWTRSGAGTSMNAILLSGGRGWGFGGTFAAGAISGEMVSDQITMGANVPLTIQGIVEQDNLSPNNINLRITAFNSGGGFLANLGFATGTGLVSVSGTTPANTAFVRAYVELAGTFTAPGAIVVRQLKAEVGSSRTVWSDDNVQAAEPGADVTGGNTAAGFIGQGNIAGTNIYRQSTAPSSPQENDIWEDTSVTPNLIKRRVGGVWVVQSEEGADITALSQRAIVPQFPIIEIKQGEAGHTGNRTVTHTVFAGASSISGGTFSLPAQNLGAGSASVNSSTGTVTLSGIVQSGSYTIRYTHTDGRPTDLAVNVTYFPTPPTASNGKIAVDTSANGIASGTYSEVLSLSLVGAPTGVAEIAASYEPSSWSGTSTNFQLRLTRAGSMIAEGSSFTGIDGTGLITPDWFTEMAQFAGFYSAASGTATWQIEARRTSGSGTIDTAIGQLVVNQQPT